MTKAVALTPSEASYVLGRSSAAINKAVDSGIIRARQHRRGRLVQRQVGRAELRFLRLADELAGDLTPDGRRRLYNAMRRLPDTAHQVRLGPLVVDLRQIDRDLSLRLARLEAVRRSVEVRDDQGEPLIKGTGVPVHVIAALARGQSVAEIIEDYPALTGEQVEVAIDYAKAYPKRGRPYPTRSFKRMLADLAAHEIDVEPTDLGPRLIGA